MIYFYDIDLSYDKGNCFIICNYTVSYLGLIDFLYNQRLKDSSLTILSIRPHTNRHNNKFYRKVD